MTINVCNFRRETVPGSVQPHLDIGHCTRATAHFAALVLPSRSRRRCCSVLVVRAALSTSPGVCLSSLAPCCSHVSCTGQISPQSPVCQITWQLRTLSIRISASCASSTEYVGLTLLTSRKFSHSPQPELTHTIRLPTVAYCSSPSIKSHAPQIII